MIIESIADAEAFLERKNSLGWEFNKWNDRMTFKFWNASVSGFTYLYKSNGSWYKFHHSSGKKGDTSCINDPVGYVWRHRETINNKVRTLQLVYGGKI